MIFCTCYQLIDYYIVRVTWIPCSTDLVNLVEQFLMHWTVSCALAQCTPRHTDIVHSLIFKYTTTSWICRLYMVLYSGTRIMFASLLFGTAHLEERDELLFQGKHHCRQPWRSKNAHGHYLWTGTCLEFILKMILERLHHSRNFFCLVLIDVPDCWE